MSSAPTSKTGIASDVTKSAKSLAQQAAKQIAQEPWEILRQAGGQIFPNERNPYSNSEPEYDPEAEWKRQDQINQDNEKILKERDSVRSQRLIQALQAEIRDIQEKNKQKVAARQYQEGQQGEESNNAPKPIRESGAKKDRRFKGFGKKKTTSMEQTMAERPIVPST